MERMVKINTTYWNRGVNGVSVWSGFKKKKKKPYVNTLLNITLMNGQTTNMVHYRECK